MVRVANLTRRYGDFSAVGDVSFALSEAMPAAIPKLQLFPLQPGECHE